MVAAFVLTSAISETNLGKRIALSMVVKFGRTKVQTLTRRITSGKLHPSVLRTIYNSRAYH